MNNEEQQNEEQQNEYVAQPGENVDDLVISIHVNQHGESQLAINRNNVSTEQIYFHLNFMAQALLQNHQANMARAYAERKRLVIPNQNISLLR